MADESPTREDMDLMGQLMDEALRHQQEGGVPVPPPPKQLRVIKGLMDEAEEEMVEAGTLWYLVGARWMDQWAGWCQRDPAGDEPPLALPPIDSSDLVDDGNLHMNPDLIGIRPGLRERRDYYILPEAAWQLLSAWHRVEGYVIVRKAYEYARGEARVEVDLARIPFEWVPSAVCDTIQLSHAASVLDLRLALGVFMGHRHPEVQWPQPAHLCFSLEGREGGKKYALTEGADDTKSLDEVGLLTGDSFLWADAVPCPDAKGLAGSLADDFKIQSGLVGLRNLGNTCFMNSALQCLSNCEAVQAFFLSGAYASDINRENRLGTGGVLVDEFAKLLRAIWGSPSFSVVDPLAFKYALGRFEGRFLGYHQQDSQEFLSALLDRIHEDLNRIRQKPYTETPDRAGRPDDEVAAEAWQLHRSRNDSRIVDLFHGQLKSTVTCPECAYVSVTFDPFMFLTLPLPSKRPRTLKVVIISDRLLDQVDIPVPKGNRTVGGLKEAILSRAGVSPERYTVELAEVYNGDIYREFTDDEESTGNIRQPQDVLHAYIVERDRPYVWLTFSVSSHRMRLGYPLLVASPEGFAAEPTGEPEEEANSRGLQQALVQFSQNPRIDQEHLAIHPRKLERKGRFPASYHVFVAAPFLMGFSADAPIEAGEEERASLAFHSLFLPRHSRLSSSPSLSSDREDIGLHECLDLFMQEERLSPSESWYCSRCREHRDGAGKKLDLWALPEILVVHLKRFAYDSYYGHKINSPVAFPIK